MAEMVQTVLSYQGPWPGEAVIDDEASATSWQKQSKLIKKVITNTGLIKYLP